MLSPETLAYLSGYHMAIRCQHPIVKAMNLSEPHYYISETRKVVLSKDMTQEQVQAFRRGLTEALEEEEEGQDSEE